MAFWCFLLICDLLIPGAMILGGWVLYRHPPKNANGLIGYRTARSRRSPEAWRFAQEYCGRLWWKIGWIMLLPSFLVHLPFLHQETDVVGIMSVVVMSLETAVMLLSIYPVERALKKKFGP